MTHSQDYFNQVLLYDSYCGEPLVWTDCGTVINLTREMAIKKYGKITQEVFGEKGGWQSVTFGKTTFVSKQMKENK